MALIGRRGGDAWGPIMRLLLAGSFLVMMARALAQEFPPVEKLPAISGLPDPFVFADGSRLKEQRDWPRRREEMLAAIVHYEYGEMPPAPGNTAGVELISHVDRNLKARHRQFKITCGPDEKVSFVMDALIPEGHGPFPVILRGDWCWSKTPDAIAATVLGRGYALVEFNRLEFAPDNANQTVGLYAAYPGRHFGAIAAWAWGYHRCVDFLAMQDWVDKQKIAVTGLSRGGKAALLAGATDARIALTNATGSGCCGAGCFRLAGEKSEHLKDITAHFPFWFTPGLKEFIGQEQKLPFDQHWLKAACAPRALLTTEALDDPWSNPKGTWQTYQAAAEVYGFLGVREKIGIHYRPGKHEQNAQDWEALLDFADRVLLGKKVARDFDANPF
jgi:hypothetical protein